MLSLLLVINIDFFIFSHRRKEWFFLLSKVVQSGSPFAIIEKVMMHYRVNIQSSLSTLKLQLVILSFFKLWNEAIMLFLTSEVLKVFIQQPYFLFADVTRTCRMCASKLASTQLSRFQKNIVRSNRMKFCTKRLSFELKTKKKLQKKATKRRIKM